MAEKNILIIRYESLIQDKRILANKMEHDMQKFGEWQYNYNESYTELLNQESKLAGMINKKR